MPSIFPLSKVVCSSRFNLAAAAFDLVNYHNDGSHPVNSTMTADTPMGVLGGSVATMTANDWESSNATQLTTPIGLFSDNSEGNAFENAPAAASGVVGIYMCGGLFECFIFETNSWVSPYSSLLSSYATLGPLYVSVGGLITNETQASQTSPGTTFIIGYCTKVPTASDLRLGIKLII